MIASDAPDGGAGGARGGRRWLPVALLVAVVVALGSGGAALAVRLTTSTSSGSVALVATVPAADRSTPAVADIALTGDGGSVALTASAPSPAHAPALTDLGLHAIAAGDYTGVSATVNGHRMTARLVATLHSGGLLPVLLVIGAGRLSAAAGNDDVNHAILAAAGQLIHPPDIAFIDQAGQPVSLHSLRGRVLVAAALDAHCHDTCPLYTALWADLQRVIRERGWQDRVAIAEISMDPDRDTPQELAAYARMTGATWPLLRSDPPSTLAFWLSLNATYYKAPSPSPAPIDWYTGKPEAYHLHHDSLAVVFDQNGDARYLLQGNPQIGHPLSAPLQALLNGGQSGTAALEKTASWSLTDLLDRVDTVLGAPIESTRGVENAARPGGRAPDATVVGLDGSRIALRSELGRALVVTFWATWCVPCRHDMPLLAAAVRRHPDLAVLAVDEGESSSQIRDYLGRLLGADAALLTPALDPGEAAGGRYGVSGLPVTVFVGPDGIVQAVRVGEMRPDDVEAVLARSGA